MIFCKLFAQNRPRLEPRPIATPSTHETHLRHPLVPFPPLDRSPGRDRPEIASGFDKQKIAALQAYLEKNPAAEDKDEALSILVDAHMETASSPPSRICSRSVTTPRQGHRRRPRSHRERNRPPFIEPASSSDQRDKAKAFLTKVKAISPSIPRANKSPSSSTNWRRPLPPRSGRQDGDRLHRPQGQGSRSLEDDRQGRPRRFLGDLVRPLRRGNAQRHRRLRQIQGARLRSRRHLPR